MNWFNIDSSNGLSPVRRQATTWTNAALWSSIALGTNSVKFESIYKFLIHENALENVVCEMAAILSSVRWVDVMIDKPYMIKIQ